jgi:hypothetical protein
MTTAIPGLKILSFHTKRAGSSPARGTTPTIPKHQKTSRKPQFAAHLRLVITGDPVAFQLLMIAGI